jgi:hypothetical protein
MHGEATNIHRILIGKPEGKRDLEISSMRRVILQWILKKYGGRAWTGFMSFLMRFSGSFFEERSNPWS